MGLINDKLTNKPKEHEAPSHILESEYTQMNYHHERIFFGTTNLIGCAVAILGAILSEGDTRWFCVTLTVGIIVSTCMALMTRNTESMKVVSGRFLFALTCTVLATRLVPYAIPSMAEAIYNDVLLLGVVSGIVNVLAFTVGYGLIKSLNDEKISLGRWLKDILIMLLTRK